MSYPGKFKRPLFPSATFLDKSRRLAGAFFVVAGLIGFTGNSSARAATFYYTFGKGDGGFAKVEIADDTGQITGRQTIAPSGIAMPKKSAVTPAGDRAIVTSDMTKTAEVYELGTEPKLVSTLDLGQETKDVLVRGDHAVLAGADGMFFWINLQDGKIERTWDAHKELTPPGSRGDSLFPVPGKNEVLATFQKDSGKGKLLGSRIVVLDLDTLTPKTDLPLPRNHPELHIEGNPKEQGPDPEVAFLSPKSDTLALTLDLYGAIAFAKLSSALDGKWENLDYVPCSLDGSWGNAFPDRGRLFEIAGKEYLMISNASPDGGLVLFDVAARRIVGKFPNPAGCEPPVYLPLIQKAFTGPSGKVKTRLPTKQVKEYKPETDLLLFDLAPVATGKEPAMERISFDKPVYQIQAIAPEKNNLLFIVVGGDDGSDLLVYDPVARKIVSREPAPGAVSRVIAWSPSPGSEAPAPAQP